MALALITIATLLFFVLRPGYYLMVLNASDHSVYASYPVKNGDWFSIEFVHSVNKSPVVDCYEIRDHKIYVEKTIYYGFGAGVQTELEEGQSLTYGEDGSMIVSGFDKEMNPLTYFVGTVSDHILKINGKEISLRDLCGRNARVSFAVRFCLRRP